MSYKLRELPEFKELVVKKRKRIQPEKVYTTSSKFKEEYEELRKLEGKIRQLEKSVKKEAYCFLFGKPKKLTPSEIMEFKEAGMKIVYLTEEEAKNK